MNPSFLPDDILQAIFCELTGISVTRCRQVCHRWKEAVDSLSDNDWKKICNNEAMYGDYVTARDKCGLSWRESYKAIVSWKRISAYEMFSQELCDGTNHFFVMPKGIVACLQNNENRLTRVDCSDTIVYYDTATFEECGRLEFEKPFISSRFFENEYLKVLLLLDASICVVINETQQEFIVGSYNTMDLVALKMTQYTVIGKEVYFKNSRDEVLYVSKLINDGGTPTIKTERLEAFLENHESYEESVIAFAIKDGNVVILSDEGNKANIYIHENADLAWASQFYHDEMNVYFELQGYGFDWKSPAIYDWLQNCTGLKQTFYSHGNVYLTTRNFGKSICIYYFPYYIYCPEHLLSIFKGKPRRVISKKELVPDSGSLKGDRVCQLDIIETPTSHKILARIGKKVFVMEFVPGQDKMLSSMKGSKTSKHLRKRVLQKIKKTATVNESATKKTKTQTQKKILDKTSRKKTVYTAKKKTAQKGKKTAQKGKKSAQKGKKPVNKGNKSGQKTGKTQKKAGNTHKHSYATRSSTK